MIICGFHIISGMSVNSHLKIHHTNTLVSFSWFSMSMMYLLSPSHTYIIVWGDRKNSNLDSLFITQKKIIRTCTNSIWLEHTTPLFLSFKKIKICDIYIQQLAVHMYRYHHDLLPPGLPNNKFTVQSNIYNYNTRQALDLHIDPTNTKLAKNTIKTQGPMIWNSINKNH